METIRNKIFIIFSCLFSFFLVSLISKKIYLLILIGKKIISEIIS